ncbi:MAG: ATP-binding protein [Myxococcales bacterium]
MTAAGIGEGPDDLFAPDRVIFDSALDAMLIADDERRYVEVNPAACELFGMAAEQLRGRRIDEFSDAQFDVEVAWLAFLENGALEGEFPLRRPDGTVRIVDFRARAHIAPHRHLSILRDVTERKRSEELLLERDRTRELFVAVLGHDLKNPLQGIQSGAKLLQLRGLDPAQAKVVERILSSSRRMVRMVEEILDLTRARLGGGMELSLDAVDLAQLGREVVSELEVAQAAPRVAIECEGDLVAELDADRVARLLSNVIGNALQHREGPVSVRLRGEPAQIVVEVTNGGAPIPPDILASIFDPFRSGARRGGDHLGLGLFISRAIAEAHGGTLSVESSEQTGTRFRATLPRSRR